MKKSSFISYHSLLNDDDSGIVLTASQTSIDKNLEPSSSNTSVNTVTDIQPPQPAPRKSKSPQIVTKNTIQDRLVLGQKTSSHVSALTQQQKSVESTTQAIDELLINLDTPVDSGGDNKALFPESIDPLSSFDQKSLDSAGDYVKLRENPIRQNSGNRRSISRTPAMKLPSDVTPKRPSIRRERSPISPDEEEKGISAFDPLWDSDTSPVMQLTAKVEKGSLSSIITTSPPTSNSDSLLKTWEIGHLTPGTNIPLSNFDYSQPNSTVPTISGQGFNATAYFSPQPYVQRNLINSPLSTGNTPSHKHPPQLPPRPKNRPHSGVFPSPQITSSSGILQPQSMSGQDTSEKSDPFADLVNLNKERTSPQPKKSQWETFD